MQLNLRCKTRKSMTTEEGLVPWSGVGSRITCAVYPVLSPPCNQRWYSGSHYTLLQSHNSPAQTILPTMGSTLLNPPQWRFGVFDECSRMGSWLSNFTYLTSGSPDERKMQKEKLSIPIYFPPPCISDPLQLVFLVGNFQFVLFF